ncbi:MAG: type I restriction enzyme HsdR N-terminal domain-containing protein [Hydrotalea flava]|uniref:type I restriction enzyme HsdR N-terminal domain-containing protein n=1 Tax=Hydrotalea TaxID=1004300 RepID=UPI000945595C|nr:MULTISPECIES: type I restriction enzyme HsdR N-terminal domain-containing protein [Hydrotalea]MBY0348917.1 type I restriction enzyme HsdR N-terminal domain-containing protein [Hydrotalea flava]RWZ87914.1 MAG: type I restriction enzyme HsdR N-terminal domain-containing protein [Hydrotalea sp. AMD]
MIQIQYPKPDFSIKEQGEKAFIFDTIRKSWVTLTPEEWVRQNFLNYLVKEKKYPASLIAVEQEIRISDKKKRFDIAIYKNKVPWMLIECKEMKVSLSTSIIDQILSYQQILKTDYLVITNGNQSFCWDTMNGKALDDLPEYHS